METPTAPLDITTTTGCTKNKDKDTYKTPYWGEKSPVRDKSQEGERERKDSE